MSHFVCLLNYVSLEIVYVNQQEFITGDYSNSVLFRISLIVHLLPN